MTLFPDGRAIIKAPRIQHSPEAFTPAMGS